MRVLVVTNIPSIWKTMIVKGIALFRTITPPLTAKVFCAAILVLAGAAHGGERGLIGPGQSGAETAGKPPFDPAAWTKAGGYVLDSERAWGRRFKPRAVFQIPGGMGVLYNSSPPHDFEAPEGFASEQTGSLAFTRNLLDWRDYPDNPVLHKLESWQGSQRAMPRAMLYDPKNEQWVVYFGDRYGEYPGVRATGTAYSKDLLNWRHSETPTITIEDIYNAAPDRIRAPKERLDEEGRVYTEWALFHEGRYYQQVFATSAGRLLLVSGDPGGPFEYVEEFQGDFMPASRPVYSDGRWYTVFSDWTRSRFAGDKWGGEKGFGLAWSEDLLGPYEMNPQNPIITTDMTERARPQLFRYDGTWAILFARGPHPGPMRVAIANVHPNLIPRDDK